MSYQKSFQDFKAEISFIAVLEELGYKLDKSKGRAAPSYVLLDANKKEMDRVYIFKPNDNANSNYFRRNPGPGRGRGGDVVGFIRENISSFPEYVGARNEVDAVNRVCYRFCGVLLQPCRTYIPVFHLYVIPAKFFGTLRWVYPRLILM